MGSPAAPLLGHPFGTRTSFSEDTLSVASLGATRGSLLRPLRRLRRAGKVLAWGFACQRHGVRSRRVLGLRSLSPEGRREACRVKDQVLGERLAVRKPTPKTRKMITKPPRRCQIPRGGFLCVTGFYPFIRFASCTRPLAKYRYRLADVMATHWHYARRLNANTVMPNRSKNPDEGSGTAPEPTIMD